MHGFSQEATLISNSLIIGHVKSGKLHHALSVYQRLDQDQSGYLANPAFVALLKACTKLKDIINGVNIHAEVARMQLPNKNVFIGSVLVDMYVKCGYLVQARQVFDNLLLRNVVSWTSLIVGYVEHGDSQEALDLFEKMVHDKVYPNHVTFVCILKACTSLRNTDKGATIHAEIERQGLLEKHPAIRNTLVDMYAKCGLLALAQEVFDTLPCRDTVTWTALITGYVEHGLGEEALYCFEEMQLEGSLPDVVTFVGCLKACALVGDIGKCQEIHAEIEKQGLSEKNVFVGSALIDMYAKLGLVVSARDVFDRLPERGVIAWNALMAGYVEHRHNEEALECFLQMKDESILADHATFICSLKACGHLGDTDLGKDIHAEIEIRGILEKYHVVGGTLVDFYAKCQLLAIAQQVFDRLPVRDLVSWHGLIAGYIEADRDFEALECLDRMQLEGVFPDNVTISYGLKACGNLRNIHRAYELHLWVAKKGLLEQDSALGGALVDLYAKCGQLPTAERLFDRLSPRDLASRNALISGYVEHGHGGKALESLERMQNENVFPDAITYVGCLKSCACIGAINEGIKLHCEIERLGLLEANVPLGNTLVDIYAKCGLLGFSAEVFDRLPIRDVVSWTTFITGYVEHGLGDKAFTCVELMQLEGCCPSVATLVCGLKAAAILGDTDKGQKLHAVIEKRGLLDRDTGVGNSLINMYAESGLLATAQELLLKLLCRDAVSWTVLISKYAENGYCEEALECFEQMQHEGVSPDVVTFLCSLKACNGVRIRNKMKKLQSEIHQKFSDKNHIISSSLVDIYAKCGLLKKAREVFDKLPVHNTELWNVLIAGYAEQGYGKEALGCLEEMQCKGISADLVTLICCLQACGIIGAIGKGLELHAEIERQGLLRADLVGNTLVDMYAKCGSLARAQQVVDKLPLRDVVSWTALMQGYAHTGESGNVFSAFERMLKDCISPDPITFVVILSACSRAGLYCESLTFFEAMSKNYGIVPIVEHHTCLLDLLSRSGQLEEASATIKKLFFGPSLVVCRSVLSACRSMGNMNFAKEAFKCATLMNLNDHVAYNPLSQKCAGSG